MAGRSKDRKGFSDFETLVVILFENPSLKQRVLYKLREIRQNNRNRAKAAAFAATQRK